MCGHQRLIGMRMVKHGETTWFTEYVGTRAKLIEPGHCFRHGDLIASLDAGGITELLYTPLRATRVLI
jgi:hypothetical protein